MASAKGYTYREAGVDLDAHSRMHRIALSYAEQVNRLVGAAVEGLGGYAAGFRLGAGMYTLHVDGVGTKTLVLERLGRLWVAGWDCVAMNANDVAVAGYKPVALVDYIAMERADVDAFNEIAKGLAEASARVGAAIVGGETAILPGLSRGFDVVCAVLAVRVAEPRGRARPGDVLVGVASSGLHANGYSLVRRVVEEELGDYNVKINGVDLAEELAKPTMIYQDLLLQAYQEGYATAAAHITGGAFRKVRRILCSTCTARIEAPEPPEIFKLVMRLGRIPVDEMYRVFNMGVGLVIAAPRDEADNLMDLAEKLGYKPYRLGVVERGRRMVLLETPYGRVEL